MPNLLKIVENNENRSYKYEWYYSLKLKIDSVQDLGEMDFDN